MKTHGVLSRWNDERGFGFITLPHNGEEIFVHVSSFPRDGIRPHAGELISFEIQTGADGKKRAIDVSRPSRAKATQAEKRRSGKSFRKPISHLMAVIIIGTVAVYGFKFYSSRHKYTTNSSTSSSATPDQRAVIAEQPFKCDGRTHCSQMTSCEEATYFLENCPSTEMDGNHDGEPCEKQWCN